jgi:hypothetical protein
MATRMRGATSVCRPASFSFDVQRVCIAWRVLDTLYDGSSLDHGSELPYVCLVAFDDDAMQQSRRRTMAFQL